MAKSQMAKQRNIVLLLVSVAAGLVVIVFAVVSAAPKNLEIENGTIAGNASTLSDASASSAGAVRFGGVSAGLSWQEAWDTRNQATIDAWYNANTGYDALGLSSDTFLNIGGPIIDSSWLAANNGNGHVSFTGGRWMIERVQATRLRIAANNVTVRGCFVNTGGSGVYGAQLYPTFTSTVTGTVIEFCTMQGGGSEMAGMLFAGTAEGVATSIVRNNDIFGYAVGIQVYRNITVEYNQVHDLHYYTGSHNTSSSNRGANVRYYRNNFDDGNSSALSLYADDLIHNLVVEQNLFNTSRANYCLNFPASKDYFDEVYDTHLINNIFGQKYSESCGSSRPMTGGNWTTNSGNTLMNGDQI